MELIQRMQDLQDAGRSEEEIAGELGVSVEWVRMVMGSDGFKVRGGGGDEEE